VSWLSNEHATEVAMSNEYEIYLRALKTLHEEITRAGQPVGAGA
jgi:hypothetical protein